MELEWIENEYDENGFTGKYKAFSVFYDGFTSKNSTKKIKLVCYLHGIKTELGHYESHEKAKQKAEKALKIWLEGIQLK